MLIFGGKLGPVAVSRLTPVYTYRNTRPLLIYFFFKNLCWTHVHFWGHWYPCFRLLVMSPLGFKARVGSALFELCRGVHDICSLRFTSGATPLPVYIASIAASRFPHMHVSAEVGMPDFESQTSCLAGGRAKPLGHSDPALLIYLQTLVWNSNSNWALQDARFKIDGNSCFHSVLNTEIAASLRL